VFLQWVLYKHILLAIIGVTFTIYNTSFAQSFVFKVSDTENKNIELAYLRIYTADSTSKLLDYKIVRKGIITYKPNFQYSSVRFLITSGGYLSLTQIKNLRNAAMNDTLHFVLQKFNNQKLDTVIVATKRPVVVHNDTTTYNVEAFKDGTERKLQDVLKKLPGIDVNEKSGEIKFKGKPIETVLLEGDNLFGANYTLGTKNISADIVKEVQAIENYYDNYVLKGLEKDEKVVLNIKITKSKLNLSGVGELGIGLLKPNKKLIDANINLIGLQQAHKFFTAVSYNNLGENKSPIDYFGNNLSLEQIKDRRLWAEKFISDPNFSSFLNTTRANFNAQFFGNYNGLYKLSKKTSLKINLYYLNDELKNTQSFENQYYIASDTTSYKDLIVSNKKPSTYKADLYLRNNTSAKALIEYTASFSKENINSVKAATSNFVPTYRSNLFTENIFIKNTGLYTQRVGKKQALQFTLFNSYSSINQLFTLAPSIYKRNRFENDLQLSDMQKVYTLIQSTLYGANKNGVYNFSLKKVIETNAYFSNVSNDSTANIKLIYNRNDIKYNKNSWVQSGNIRFRRKEWKIATSYAFTYLKQRLLNKLAQEETSKTNFTFEPNLNVTFVLSKISHLSTSFSLTQKPKLEKHIAVNDIVENYRSVVSNIPSLDLIKTQTINLNYSRNDLFNQFDNSIGISYQKNDGDYLPVYIVTDSIIYAKYLFKNIRTKGIDINAITTKYFPVLRSTFKLSALYSINEYYNSLNSSELRNNQGSFISYEFFYKSIFSGKLNFENVLTFNASISNNIGAIKVINQGIENSMKIIVKPNNRIKTFISGDYYRQSLQSPSYNFFLDYHFLYTPFKRKSEFRFIVRNLLDTQNFTVFQVSDFSKSQFMTNILPRSVIFYFSHQF